jgi:hypothetical protein
MYGEGGDKMSWRPEDWPKCPCDGCANKVEDEYGLVCDLSCGKHSAWRNREAGADAMLTALKMNGVRFNRHWNKTLAHYTMVFIPDD